MPLKWWTSQHAFCQGLRVPTYHGTHQLLVYADDVNMLGGNVHTIKENAEALVVASKKTGLEVLVHADNIKYMVMFRVDQVRLAQNRNKMWVS